MRAQFFRNSIHLIKQKPLVGYGTGSFKNEYFKTFGYPAWGPVKPGQPNNSYFVITVQLGVVGLILYLLFLLSLWRDSIHPDHKTSANEVMLVGFTIGCLTESFVRLSVGGFFFVFLISLILITKNNAKKS
jgi:O-antigen ligase